MGRESGDAARVTIEGMLLNAASGWIVSYSKLDQAFLGAGKSCAVFDSRARGLSTSNRAARTRIGTGRICIALEY